MGKIIVKLNRRCGLENVAGEAGAPGVDGRPGWEVVDKGLEHGIGLMRPVQVVPHYVDVQPVVRG